MVTTFKSMVHLQGELGHDLFDRLFDPSNTGRVREFLMGFEAEELAKLLPVSIEDDEAAARLLVEHERYDKETTNRIVQTWRKLAQDHGYSGPILWQVPAGFTLKSHAPKAGPCYDSFGYLQDWSFEDASTPDALVFWIPRVLKGSTSKTASSQLEYLKSEQERLALPAQHLKSFGSSALIAALILSHFKRSGERTPLKHYWVRTDTRGGGRDRLALGDFDECGLYCNDVCWDGDAYDNLGVFPLGVETLDP